MNSERAVDDIYLQYIQKLLPAINADMLSKVTGILSQTSWDTPNSSDDWNNVAVVALSEAEECVDNLVLRSVYLEMAFEALNNGLNIDGHPLCAAHLALIYSMIGEKQKAIEIALNALINNLQAAYTTSNSYSHCLIYIFTDNKNISDNDRKCFEQILLAENSYEKAVFLLIEIICHSQLVFYTAVSRRFLHLASQLFPNSVDVGLKLGISSLMTGELEGILYLHQARKLAPNYAPILQALHLAYRDLNQIEVSDYWQEISRKFYQSNSPSSDWHWTQLASNSLFTYVPFEGDLIMAVEPSLRSIATSVLIAEQDWFEKEMEFWRNSIKPGMTVIDVGANVGVYTFSAALKVGSEGRVLAVEPFSGCIRCLQETCRINQLSWVNVCEGAASDRNGTVKLLLHSANELNQIISSDAAENMSSESFEEATCFTLDSLIEQENIERVDFLKIDAEGHEMAVLIGSQKLLTEFLPIILYENIAGSQGSNIEVAQYLADKGYELFHYQPYTQKLIEVDSVKDFQEQLNLIAFPPHKATGLKS
ncbi:MULTISPECIES: FkbM family methyltransferase [Nostoc]|uniref:FkbM family methyltransferase n=2 Tax=Nostoc TaxID=1177 RepID=A0ABR8I9M1_9NOSO|nr:MULTISPECIES: FkbM family methyltransferase [Nostoc]MBD2563085.1 FkbM family methyltransferase [Nostoc linckia FACHB-391]MBD2648170.1 FkbM family methyltransferase [Nostoc foliaceum FACHB-393]